MDRKQEQDARVLNWVVEITKHCLCAEDVIENSFLKSCLEKIWGHTESTRSLQLKCSNNLKKGEYYGGHLAMAIIIRDFESFCIVAT